MIKFENVNKIWPNGVHALKNINFEIEEGDFVAIIGLSGAGKTTLLRSINKMNTISSGAIKISMKEKNKNKEVIKKEYEINKLNQKQLRKLRQNIGLISQHYNNIGTQTVLKNVLISRVSKMNFLRSFIGIFTKKEKLIALNSLDKLKILDYAYARSENLSGGQQQRVALARILTQEPQLIIADEPVSALDPILATQVMDDFKTINDKEKITVVMNIHHVGLALKYAKKIIGVKNGKIVFYGDVKNVDQTILESIYGSDYERIE